MMRRRIPILLRAAADALLGLVVFLSMTAMLFEAQGAAPLPPWSEATAGARADVFILAVVFSIIVAINLAFYRHLRRVYASPRRGAWRRDR